MALASWKHISLLTERRVFEGWVVAINMSLLWSEEQFQVAFVSSNFPNVRFLIWLYAKPSGDFVAATRIGVIFGYNGNAVHCHLDELKFALNHIVRHKISINC